MKNALLHRRLDEFGGLLDLEWQHKKRMSPRISHRLIDELYDVARREGALGGKVTGAGGGGYMLLYCHFDRKLPGPGRPCGQLAARSTEVALEPLGLQTWRVP